MSKKTRCSWVPEQDEIYVAYHDEEWGVPEYDDQALFEKLLLDGFQAGLSWRTILYKRDNFRRAFDGFDPHKVARFTPKRIERLLTDKGIVRHRGKLESAVKSARVYLELMEGHPGGFTNFLWEFVGGSPRQNGFASSADIPTASDESSAMSKALKRAGFNFCGPTICYAFMQAVGMVNDHTLACFRHKPVARAGS
jgi:DNA-3-methyladenine glycosylase I